MRISSYLRWVLCNLSTRLPSPVFGHFFLTKQNVFFIPFTVVLSRYSIQLHPRCYILVILVNLLPLSAERTRFSLLAVVLDTLRRKGCMMFLDGVQQQQAHR